MKIFKTLKSLLKTTQPTHKKSLSFSSNHMGNTSQLNSYFYTVGKPVWMARNYNQFANEAYIKNVSPVSDWYGLSAVEAAAYSIDQHNNAAAWNQALLQNGARPSGAIVVKNAEGQPSELSDEQYSRLKEMVSEDFTGSVNAGKPMILEGGLDWKEISLSPKDMDFIEGKNSAARDIALAFGVKLDKDNIPAIANKRETIWERLEKVSFMTINEKRKQVGLAKIQGGDNLA